jgi:hypothetical protein
MNNIAVSLPTVTRTPRFQATTFQTFGWFLEHAQDSNERIRAATSPAWLVASTPAVEFYLTDDGLSGFGVASNGELVGVFSLVKGRGEALMNEAIYRGATHLDCFEGFLPGFYASFGFIEVGSAANWEPNGPRVVYMALSDAQLVSI